MAVMRPKRIICIRLKYASRIDTTKYPTTMVTYYYIEQLCGSASVSVGPKVFRVNDVVTPEEADELCANFHYEVTVNH